MRRQDQEKIGVHSCSFVAEFFKQPRIRSFNMRSPFNSKTLYRKVSYLCIGFTLALLLPGGVIGIRIGRAQEAPGYRNPNLPVERRVADLLSRMTVEEKVAQITTLWVGKPQQKPHDWSFPDRGDFSPEKAAVVMKHGIGQIARQRERKDARQSAVFANALQKWLKENTRLGIPAMFHDEALHGHMAQGNASFPTPISLASSWDPDLITKVFTAAALETRIRGGHQVLGPNLAPVNVSERVLREVFLPTFEAAVKEAGVMSVMPSYNEIDGVPSHGSHFLLEKILRQEWGFKGMVASDYFGITELATRHQVAADKAAAAIRALEAGVDIELPDPDCYALLPQLINEGRVATAALDRAVARTLRAKFLLGLFENPYVDPERAAKLTNGKAHQDLAAEAARRSITLLKNEGGLLPLDRAKLKSIAIVGPNAAGVHLGGYSDNPGRGVGILEGVRNKVGEQIKVNYAEGCKI